MKRASDLIPWKVTDISLRPFDHFWSMNPSVHFDGNLWRCVLRCADYCMPGGKTTRSSKAKPGESRSKNAMVILDPSSWKAVEIYKMHEHDDLPRTSCSSIGYEDMRIFRTDKGGLQGIAASLHLHRGRGTEHKQMAEQVLLSFDAQYDIVKAHPIRGNWSDTPQKNWVPFDNCTEPRFLYSISTGTMFDDRGRMRDVEGLVRSSVHARPSARPDARARKRARERASEREKERAHEDRRRASPRERASSAASSLPPTSYENLRGGTQLVRIEDDKWLGIGHAMKFVDNLKLYWHVWYLVDSHGKLKATSPPMKLAPNNGIEFAAGMAIDGDRVVVSFGVDDLDCRIGETRLSAVLAALQPITRS